MKPRVLEALEPIISVKSATRERLKPVVKTLGDPLFWTLSKRELHSLLRRFPESGAASILPITQQYRGQGWYKGLGAYQVMEEFRSLADWARDLAPRVVVEIGTAAGATLLLWSRTVQKHVISIDLPGGIHGGGYDAHKGRLFHEFVHDRPQVKLDLVRASSHEVSTKAAVQRLLAGELVDLLFIDGDHRIEGATRDFELWRDLVRPGGHVVFHDVVPHAHLPECKVDVLWERIKSENPNRTTEFVASHNQGWAGIGILQV